MNSDTILVEIQQHRLTDGGFVYNVLVSDGPWFAVDKDSAYALQDAIVEAARKYAINDTVRGFGSTEA